MWRRYEKTATKSPNTSSGTTIPLACLLLGKTCVNKATERMLRPVIPAFDTPTIKAPRTANIHCRGSKVMFQSTVGVVLASLCGGNARLSSDQSLYVQSLPRYRGTGPGVGSARRRSTRGSGCGWGRIYRTVDGLVPRRERRECRRA